VNILLKKIIAFDEPFNISKNYAYIMLKFLHSPQNYINGEQQMHLIDECFLEHYREYMGLFVNFYAESIVRFLSIVEESGIKQHWEEAILSLEKTVPKNDMIKLVHLEKFFKMIIFGWILAICSFVLELVNAKFKKCSERIKVYLADP
jgi:hypothetical protein